MYAMRSGVSSDADDTPSKENGSSIIKETAPLPHLLPAIEKIRDSMRCHETKTSLFVQIDLSLLQVCAAI